MSFRLVPHVKVESEFQPEACAHGVMQSSESVGSVVSVLSTLVCDRHDQFCTILLKPNWLPAKRRYESTVPVAPVVVARLTHGATMMSSSQLWMTADPGP